MNIARKLFLALLLTVAMAAAADSRLVNLVMPDATVVVGINVQKAYATDFGQFLASLMNLDSPQMQNFVALSGFDPRLDLNEVVLASPDGSFHQGTLAIASGKFDPAGLLQLVATTGGATTEYQGVTVAIAKDKTTVAFLSDSIAVAGDPDSVQGAIDRSQQKASLSPSLLAKINQVSAGNELWAVSSAPLPNLGGAKSPVQGDVLKSIQQTSGGVQLGATLQLSAEAVTDTSQNASALVDMVKLLTSLLQMNRQDPKAAAVVSVLDTLKVQANANTVKLSLAIPEAQLEQLIQQQARKK